MQEQLNKVHFTDDDKKKFIEFLNFVHDKAKWEIDTKEVLAFFKLMAYMQQSILPKIDANILEIKEVGKLTPGKPADSEESKDSE